MQGVKKKKKREVGDGEWKKKKNLVFWLQKQQPRVFDLKCADVFFAFLFLSLRVNRSFPHE